MILLSCSDVPWIPTGFGLDARLLVGQRGPARPQGERPRPDAPLRAELDDGGGDAPDGLNQDGAFGSPPATAP